VDRGLTFTTYEEAFWFFGLKEKTHNRLFQNGTKAKVIGVSKHKHKERYDWNMYALRDSEGNECVIGEEGIKLAGIDKQEWLFSASVLFDRWMKISGGYVPKEDETCYFVDFNIKRKELQIDYSPNHIHSPFCFNHENQSIEFLSENQKELKTFFHQV
jgi:hypothetical protein